MDHHQEALELLWKGTTTEELMRRFEERLNALSTGNGYDAQQEETTHYPT